MAQTTRSADLTSGPMLQKIILFSIPLAASSILQLLFNCLLYTSPSPRDA